MRKDYTIALVLLMLISGSIFAKGQEEERYYPRMNGPGYGWNYDEQESIEIAGNLELVNGNPPYLVTGADRYMLMVPYHLLYELDIENGEEIFVTGYETAGHMWQWDDSEKALFVTSAVIKEEEYDLSGYSGYMGGGRGGFGGFGRRGRGCGY